MSEVQDTQKFKPENFLILVVDDTIRNLQLVIEILDDSGYSTTFANSGKQALERVKLTRPDLILLDLMMPEMSGLEVCQAIKAEQIYEDLPIIFLTASSEQNDLVKAFNEGAVDYITKPFKKYELLARVKTHLTLKYTKDILQTALEQIKILVTTDDMLGISNRRHILQLAEQEYQRSKRYNHPLSLLMLDIDHFKRFNDDYNHLVGDQVLITVVNTIQKCLRTVDSFGRMGGEEFIIILTETSRAMALVVAERIRQAVEETVIEYEHLALQATISIGVASLQAEVEDIDKARRRADEALLIAKRQGRNRIVDSGEINPESVGLNGLIRGELADQGLVSPPY
jgi:diguanylate cyclase (GGDEF)-like protein